MLTNVGTRPINLSVTRAAWIVAHLEALDRCVPLPDIHARRVRNIANDLRGYITEAVTTHTAVDLDALREQLVEAIDGSEAA